MLLGIYIYIYIYIYILYIIYVIYIYIYIYVYIYYICYIYIYMYTYIHIYIYTYFIKWHVFDIVCNCDGSSFLLKPTPLKLVIRITESGGGVEPTTLNGR